MKGKYTVSELASLRKTSERATYNLLKKFSKELKPYKVKEGLKVYYLTEALSVLGIKQPEKQSTPLIESAKLKELESKIQKLQQANEMLNFQISANYEMINDLRKDKEQLYKTISSQDKTINQLAETVKGSLMNTHTAQELNYLDKKKDK